MNKDNNYSGRSNQRGTQNKGHHRRKLTEDELIRRRNDRMRELDKKRRNTKQGDRRHRDSENYDFVGQQFVDKLKNKVTDKLKPGSKNHSKTKKAIGNSNSYDSYGDSNPYKNNNFHEENNSDSFNISDIFKNAGKSFKNFKRGVKGTRNIRKKVFKGIGILLLLILLINIFSIIKLFVSIKNTVDTEAVPPGILKPCNILVLGMDIGAVGQENDESIKRTDTMMVVNYNPKTMATKVVSIPRDTLITENNSNYKINAAYVKGGDKKVKQVVEDLLGITINYTVKVNYAAFRNVIDAIGGIDMEIDQDMKYDDDGQNLHIDFKGGTTVHLDGKKSEEFFRWRKNNDGTGLAMGDLGRIENQHKFIQKVIDKFKSPLTLIRMPKILGAVGSNIETNMGAFTIINYALRLIIHKNKIELTTLVGTPKTIKGQSYLVVDKSKNKSLIESLQGNASDDSLDSIDKSKVKILVLNGTDTSGLAGIVKTKLEGFGYKNVDVGNAEKTSKTVIKTDNKAIKEQLSGFVSNKFEALPSEYKDYDVVILIGTDYVKK